MKLSLVTIRSGQFCEAMALLFDINDSVDCKYVNISMSKKLQKYLNGSLNLRTKYFIEWRAQRDFDFVFVQVLDLVLSHIVRTNLIHIDCPIQFNVHESGTLIFFSIAYLSNHSST